MRPRIFSLILFGLLSCSFVSTSRPQSTPATLSVIEQATVRDETVLAFSVSAELFNLYVLDSVEKIQANGRRYLVSDTPPAKVPVALLIAEGDIQNWIVVRKVSGGRSRKLAPFQKNQFLYEHEGAGEYEVTTLDTNREPVFSYFVVVADGQPDNPLEPDLPEHDEPDDGDFAQLIAIAQSSSNADLSTRQALGAAWLQVVQAGGTLEELKKRVTQARADILSKVRDQDGSWNKFLTAVDSWFASQSLTRDRYAAAVTALSKWMQQ